MTAKQLSEYTVKDLGQLAKQHGISGWSSMRKAQLVKALAKVTGRTGRRKAARKSGARKSGARTSGARTRSTSSRSTSSRSTSSRSTSSRTAKSKTAKSAKSSTRKSTGKSASKSAGRSKRSGGASSSSAPHRTVSGPAASRRIKKDQDRRQQLKDLGAERNGRRRHDRLVLLVRGPYWLHAHWDLTRESVARARAAMGQQWHAARPCLRLIEIAGARGAEKAVRDIEIHGGTRDWYIDVTESPRKFRVEVGYLASGGKFYSLARSNLVTTPAPGAADGMDGHWSDIADNYEKIYALSGGRSDERAPSELRELFEERLRRPLKEPTFARYAALAGGQRRKLQPFEFTLDAELLVHGATEAGSQVTLNGDPIRLQADGSFSVRLHLPNCRQVVPVVATSPDGVHQQTIILALERNTKVMEPVIRDSSDM